jgi:hypothetical protein
VLEASRGERGSSMRRMDDVVRCKKRCRRGERTVRSELGRMGGEGRGGTNSVLGKEEAECGVARVERRG